MKSNLVGIWLQQKAAGSLNLWQLWETKKIPLKTLRQSPSELDSVRKGVRKIHPLVSLTKPSLGCFFLLPFLKGKLTKTFNQTHQMRCFFLMPSLGETATFGEKTDILWFLLSATSMLPSPSTANPAGLSRHPASLPNLPTFWQKSWWKMIKTVLRESPVTTGLF